MTLPLKTREAEWQYTGHFGEPVLDIYFRFADLYKCALNRLSPFGATHDFQWEGNNPKAFALTAYVLRFAAAVKFRVSSIEVWTNTEDLIRNAEARRTLIGAALAAVNDVQPDTTVATHRTVATTHFDVPEGSARSFAGRYLAQSGLPAELKACGVALEGTLEGGGRGLVRLEPSERFREPQCVFLAIECLQPEPLRYEEALASAHGFCQRVVSGLGLLPKQETR